MGEKMHERALGDLQLEVAALARREQATREAVVRLVGRIHGNASAVLPAKDLAYLLAALAALDAAAPEIAAPEIAAPVWPEPGAPAPAVMPPLGKVRRLDAPAPDGEGLPGPVPVCCMGRWVSPDGNGRWWYDHASNCDAPWAYHVEVMDRGSSEAAWARAQRRADAETVRAAAIWLATYAESGAERDRAIELLAVADRLDSDVQKEGES